MGVQGLKTILATHCKPAVLTLRHADAGKLRESGRNVIVVDANALFHQLLKTGTEDQRLYAQTLRWATLMQRAGLSIVAVLDGAVEIGHEGDVVRRSIAKHRDQTTGDRLSHLIFETALRDAGVEVVQARCSADPAVVAVFAQRKDTVFAVLTNDSDFFIYGVSRLAFVEDITLKRDAVTMALWNPDEAWTKLKQYALLTDMSNRERASVPAATAAAAATAKVNLKQRCCVAAILGNDESKDIRNRLESKRQANGRGIGPVQAAFIFLRSGQDTLDGDFVRDALGLRTVTDADVETAAAVALAYETQVTRAKGVPTSMLMTAACLPAAVLPEVRRRLCSGGGGIVSWRLVALMARGCVMMGSMDRHRRVTAASIGAAQAACSTPLPLHMLGPRLLVTSGVPHEWFPASAASTVACGGGGHGGGDDGGASASEEDAHDAAGVPTAVGVATAETVASLPRDWYRPTMFEGAIGHGGEIRQLSGVTQVLTCRDANGRLGTLQSTTKALKREKPEMTHSEAVLFALFLHSADPFPDEATARGIPTDSVRAAIFGRRGAAQLPTADQAAAMGATGGDDDDDDAEGQTFHDVGVVATGSSLSQGDWQDIDNPAIVAAVKAGTSFATMQGMWRPHDQGRERTAMAVHQARKIDDETRRGALTRMHSCANQTWVGGQPTRHAFQEELFGIVGPHLARVSEWQHGLRRRSTSTQGDDDEDDDDTDADVEPASMDSGSSGRGAASNDGTDTPKPLHVLLSTPTGSGKTFTFIMMHKFLVQDLHGRTVMIYSVPTKQVLKRVGQECEAHNLIYWTAGRAKDGQMFVQRPYSIRDGRRVRGWANTKGARFTGAIGAMLEGAGKKGKDAHDRGRGRPDIIIADIFATAELLLHVQHLRPSADLHPSNLLLYFDEPDMGVHMDRKVFATVKSIMHSLPVTAILASASMGTWEQLQPWWIDSGVDAERMTITRPPSSLPLCRLQLYNEGKQRLADVNVLDAFHSFDQFRECVANERKRLLLIRHLTPAQANHLLARHLGRAVGDGAEWDALLRADVNELRLTVLSEAITALDANGFNDLCKAWSRTAKVVDGHSLQDIVSLGKGMTMVATTSPRLTAMKLAGWGVDGRGTDQWCKARRRVQKAIKEAEKQDAYAEKLARSAPTRSSSPPPASSMVVIRPGLHLTIDEAKAIDVDTLTTLAMGIVYATDEVEPAIRTIFQRAMRTVREDPTTSIDAAAAAAAAGGGAGGGRQSSEPRAINCIVVEYSSIYGTDCLAVDTLVLSEDLGAHLSWAEHQQFLGRLRQDGRVVFMHPATLCASVTGHVDVGIRIPLDGDGELQGVRALVREALPSQSAAEVARALRRALTLLGTRSAVAAAAGVTAQPTCWAVAVVVAALQHAAGVAPGKVSATLATLLGVGNGEPGTGTCTATLRRLTKGRLATQRGVLDALSAVCTETDSIVSKHAHRVLHALYHHEIVTEEVVLAWADASESPSPLLQSASVQGFLQWMRTADTASDSESGSGHSD